MEKLEQNQINLKQLDEPENEGYQSLYFNQNELTERIVSKREYKNSEQIEDELLEVGEIKVDIELISNEKEETQKNEINDNAVKIQKIQENELKNFYDEFGGSTQCRQKGEQIMDQYENFMKQVQSNSIKEIFFSYSMQSPMWKCLVCNQSFCKFDRMRLFAAKKQQKSCNVLCKNNNNNNQSEDVETQSAQSQNEAINNYQQQEVDSGLPKQCVPQSCTEENEEFICKECAFGEKCVDNLGFNCYLGNFKSLVNLFMVVSFAHRLTSPKKRYYMKISKTGNLEHYRVSKNENQKDTLIQTIFKNKQENAELQAPFLMVAFKWKVVLIDKNWNILWQLQRVQCIQKFYILPTPDIELIDTYQNGIYPAHSLKDVYFRDFFQQKQEAIISNKIVVKKIDEKNQEISVEFYQLADCSGFIVLENPFTNQKYFEIVDETEEDLKINDRRDFALKATDYGQLVVSFQNSVLGEQKGSRQYFIKNQRAINLEYLRENKDSQYSEEKLNQLCSQYYDGVVGKIFLNSHFQPLKSLNDEFILLLNPITGQLQLIRHNSIGQQQNNIFNFKRKSIPVILDKNGKFKSKEEQINLKYGQVSQDLMSGAWSRQCLPEYNILDKFYMESGVLKNQYKIQWQSHQEQIGFPPYYIAVNDEGDMEIKGKKRPLIQDIQATNQVKIEEKDIENQSDNINNQTEEIVVWKSKRSKKIPMRKSYLEVENDGNVKLVDEKTDLATWSSNSKNLSDKLSEFITWVVEDVADPAIFLADVCSDIILLTEFLVSQQMFYFFCLIFCMIIERMVQIRMSYIEIKPHKRAHVLFCLIYLDFLGDKWAKSLNSNFIRKQLRKTIECVFESLPSILLNLHSIFYLMDQEGKEVSKWQFIALAFSLISASKVLYEFKVFLRHSDRELKLLGPKNYDHKQGNTKASIRTIMFIIIYLGTFSYSLGVFTSITRPYGVIIYAVCVFVLTQFVVQGYKCYFLSKKFISQMPRYDQYGINLLFEIIGHPVLLGLGGFLDWNLDYKSDQLSNSFDLLNIFPVWIAAPFFRFAEAVTFFITYIWIYEEKNHTIFGYFNIIVQLAFCTTYLILFLMTIRRKLNRAAGAPFIHVLFKALSDNHTQQLQKIEMDQM